jgi:serine/threonine-protein kinase
MGDAYAYGHLAMAALSLAMAAAFALLAWRVPSYRADLAYAVAAVLCASVALAAMALALAPSLARARLLWGIGAILYVSVPILWHVQFAADLWPDSRRRRRHRNLVIAYAVGGAVLFAAILAGWFDDGTLRHLRVGGMQSGLPSTPWWAAGLLFVFACINVWLSASLLAGPGPRRAERRSALPLMLIAPPLCGYELLIAAGVFESIPLGGYVAGLASLQGIIIVAQRFRVLEEPRRLGSWRIERRIGAGGMAEVFAARRVGAGPLAGVVQPVALKRLRPELGRDPAEAKRLIDEARILAGLSHANIVTLHDAGLEDGEIYLALELVEGASLAVLLERAGGPLGRIATVEIGCQAAAALGHAHPRGLIHRDVSPQNLLIDGEGTVKLADFGIARTLDRTRTGTGHVRGKLPYVAPEQLRGETYDQRVDLYALGVVLFQAAVGRSPFAGRSEAELVYRILEGHAEGDSALRERAGSPLAAIIERLLAPRWQERTAAAADLLAELAPLRSESEGRAELAALVSDARAASGDEGAARERRTRRLDPVSTRR